VSTSATSIGRAAIAADRFMIKALLGTVLGSVPIVRTGESP
jgi:hypothetical protein